MRPRCWLAVFHVDDARAAVARLAAIGRADLEDHTAFEEFELFASPDAGNVYRVSQDQWQVLIKALKPLTPDPGWSRRRPPPGAFAPGSGDATTSRS